MLTALVALTAAACAQRVASKRACASTGDFVLVFVRATASVRVFHVASSDAAPRALDVTVVPSLHAQDFLAATRAVLLRCALDVHAVSRDALHEDVARWTAQLQRVSADDDDADVFFRIASSSAVLTSDGRNVMSSSDAPSVVPLSALVRAPAVRTSNSSSSKAKKTKSKKPAARSPADGSSSSDATAADAYLPTLEYGDIATIDVLTSLRPSTVPAAAPVLTIPALSVKAPSPVTLHADVLVLVSLDAPVANALELVRNQLSQQVRRPLSSGSISSLSLCDRLTLLTRLALDWPLWSCDS